MATNQQRLERARFEKALQRFLDGLYALPADRTRVIDFYSHRLPNEPTANSGLFTFRLQTDSYTMEIVGDINSLLVRLHRLKAWRRVLESFTDTSEQLGIFVEFVEPLLIYGLTSPYALKNRFIYCGVKLISLASVLQSSSSPPPLPADRQINFDALKSVCDSSPVRKKFQDAVSSLNASAFNKSTREFRHRREHRFPPNLHLGLLSIVETEFAPTGLSHTFMTERPLRLEHLIPLLEEEHRKLTMTFDEYWQLILDIDGTLQSRCPVRSQPGAPKP